MIDTIKNVWYRLTRYRKPCGCYAGSGFFGVSESHKEIEKLVRASVEEKEEVYVIDTEESSICRCYECGKKYINTVGKEKVWDTYHTASYRVFKDEWRSGSLEEFIHDYMSRRTDRKIHDIDLSGVYT